MKSTKSRTPNLHFSFDTEDDSKGKAYLFNFYDIKHATHHTFCSQLDALDYVCSHRNRTYWATNLEYDINNLFRSHYGLLHFLYAGSRLIVAEMRTDRIKFMDTFNHWPMSVKKMGERIGLPKLDFDHTGKIPNRRSLEKELWNITS